MTKEQIYCSMRKAWFVATPEEHIRQKTLQMLTQSLGFPPSGIVVEKELKLLPHLPSHVIPPERRADILCYANKEGSMYPLLLIECKAVSITYREVQQVIGYNYFVKAPFIALVNQSEQRLGWYDSGKNDYQFINYFPSYLELFNSI